MEIPKLMPRLGLALTKTTSLSAINIQANWIVSSRPGHHYGGGGQGVGLDPWKPRMCL